MNQLSLKFPNVKTCYYPLPSELAIFVLLHAIAITKFHEEFYF
mgnify:CR=1 FL=1